jgi:hypothetical protein
MKITFDDIILRKAPHQKDLFHLYIKSIYCYSAHAQMKENHEAKLKTKNALFLLDIMQETVPVEILDKYANMNVLETVRSLFR